MRLLLLAFIALLFSPFSAQAASPDCASLLETDWSGFQLIRAELRDADDESKPTHCFVEGVIDTEINFHLLLPAPEYWNGRFVMGGGGGYVATVENQALAYAPNMLQDGFATVGTDTGHKGTTITATWALDRPDREVNFGHRAIHVTAETAKTIIRLFYDQDIAYSYFMGCSRGGGQAMMESQRYPDDFDGIVAGAPAYDWLSIASQFVQISQALYPDANDHSTPLLSMDHRKKLETAILDQCDAEDGLKDGILNDPRECAFDLASLPRCAAGAPGPDCFTKQQIAAIKTIYNGPVIEGRTYHPGFPYGGEAHPAAWNTWIVGRENAMGPGNPSLHFAFGTQFFKYLVYDNPDWDYTAYDFSTFKKDTKYAARILNSADPDLTAFKVSGGKILFWTGWLDSALTPLGTIEYFDKMNRHTEDADQFSRLFMMPGVTHCAGGPGPDRVDWLGAIQDWVENDKAPEQLTASKMNAQGNATMQRPICAYPAKAVFKGEGDGTSAEEFECRLSGDD